MISDTIGCVLYHPATTRPIIMGRLLLSVYKPTNAVVIFTAVGFRTFYRTPS